MVRDLAIVTPPTELLVQLALLVAHHVDLVEECVRGGNRLRRLMLGMVRRWSKR